MKKLPAETRLCAVFVDYDNIYLSLRRQDELAAKQFPKSVIEWLRQLETGELIAEMNDSRDKVQRRLVMCRCYGNPVPRRNSHDNLTDNGSFTFVRHHFLRAGFDIVDCPPLTSQLKNSSDIRMVMDIQDFLDHKTYFDEFIILSGDADFAPILQRLRTHARSTTIYVNENTAVPYVALCDGQVREQDLLARLKKIAKQEATSNKKIEKSTQNLLPDPDTASEEETSLTLSDIRNQIISEIEQAVSSSQSPVALSFLADKAQRTVGYEETIGSNWAGYGSFLNFLQNNLPDSMRITTNQPYYVVDERRHKSAAPKKEIEHTEAPQRETRMAPTRHVEPQHQADQFTPHAKELPARQQEANTILENNKTIRDTISRVHEYTHVPALAPSEYQIMFEVIADELGEVGLKGRQTSFNISSRARIESVELSPEDAQFVLDIISEADPWFEKGISPPLFAERFLNAIIARCRKNGLHLSQDEFELVSAWFTGNTRSLFHHQQPLQHHMAIHQIANHNPQNFQLESNYEQNESDAYETEVYEQHYGQHTQASAYQNTNHHEQIPEEPWLQQNAEHQPVMEPTQQLRQPYIDPLNPHGDPDSKELPRIFRFGSDG